MSHARRSLVAKLSAEKLPMPPQSLWRALGREEGVRNGRALADWWAANRKRILTEYRTLRGGTMKTPERRERQATGMEDACLVEPEQSKGTQ